MKKLLSLTLAALLCFSMLALVACDTAPAEDDGKYSIGICQLVQHPALDQATQGFIDTLKAELGEENVTIYSENASGDAQTCTTIVNNLVSKKVDLIMANATAALQAAANGTETIPVLGTSITAYNVALGVDDFDGIKDRNVSGTSDLAPLDEQAAMITDLFPEAEKIALIYCSAEPNSEYQVQEIRKYLVELGIANENIKDFSFTDTNDVATVSAAAAAFADVIYIPTDNVAASCTETISGQIGDTPVVAGEAGICAGCGVVTLSIDYYDLGVATGEMAVKILKGEAKVSDLKVGYVTEFAKLYNAERCAELGIDTAALEAKKYTPIVVEEAAE